MQILVQEPLCIAKYWDTDVLFLVLFVILLWFIRIAVLEQYFENWCNN